jgi:hypothetical protein
MSRNTCGRCHVDAIVGKQGGLGNSPQNGKICPLQARPTSCLAAGRLLWQSVLRAGKEQCKQQ